MKPNRYAWQDAKKSHRETMLRTLLQRIESAKTSGNQVLMMQLEQERQTLGL